MVRTRSQDNRSNAQSRGHSRNQPKGGRNSASTRFSDHLPQFTHTKSPEASSKTLVFCTKLHLNHCAVVGLKAKNYCCSVQGWSRDHHDH